MPKTKKKVLFFYCNLCFALLIATNSLVAIETAEIIILAPLIKRGDIKVASEPFKKKLKAGALQKLIFFLARTNYVANIKILEKHSPKKTNKNNKSTSLQSNSPIDLCQISKSQYLLYSSFLLSSYESLLELSVFDCRRRIVITRKATALINEIQLQSKINTLLRQVLSPLSFRRSQKNLDLSNKNRTWMSSEKTDILFVIDSSGSMSYELSLLKKSITRLLSSLPIEKYRYGIILIRDDNKIKYLSLTRDTEKIARIISRQNAEGTNTAIGLLRALAKAKDLLISSSSSRILFFCDTPALQKKHIEIRNAITNLLGSKRNTSFLLSFFLGKEMSYESKLYLEKLDQSFSSLYLARPIYGLQATYHNQKKLFFLKAEEQFFVTKENPLPLLKNSRKNADFHLELYEPLAISSYGKKKVNLRTVPKIYGERNFMSLKKLSPLYANFEYHLYKEASRQKSKKVFAFSNNKYGKAKVLLKNNGKVFWLQVEAKRSISLLQRRRGSTVCIGSHFQKNKKRNTLQNIAKYIYIKDKCPELLKMDWEQLNLMKIKYSDIWFINAQVLKVKLL